MWLQRWPTGNGLMPVCPAVIAELEHIYRTMMDSGQLGQVIKQAPKTICRNLQTRFAETCRLYTKVFFNNNYYYVNECRLPRRSSSSR